MLLLKGVVTSKVQQASGGATSLIISSLMLNQTYCLHSLNLVQH